MGHGRSVWPMKYHVSEYYMLGTTSRQIFAISVVHNRIRTEHEAGTADIHFKFRQGLSRLCREVNTPLERAHRTNC